MAAIGTRIANTMQSLLIFLATHGIDIADCRGQSYDNASNMSGKYNGMQAIIRQRCVLVDYVPAHLLNLVGQSAASCCHLAVCYLDFLQRLYSFFAASTHRWKVLINLLTSKSLPQSNAYLTLAGPHAETLQKL